MNESPISSDDDLVQVLASDADGTTRHALVQYLTEQSRQVSSTDASADVYMIAADIVERLGISGSK